MTRPAPRGRQLTVGDLFCGAGGFSEGFAQAGFKIAWGVDNWRPAVETFSRNHPGAKAIQADIMDLDPSILEPVEVLIGSPPCVHFSPANKGGNGDKEAGLKMVRRFLTLVRALQPKYWVMENVPALKPVLESQIRSGRIRLYRGSLEVPVPVVVDAARFGTPQTRKRLLTGNFPAFTEANLGRKGTPLTLESIVTALPDPRRGPPHPQVEVADPVYPLVKVVSTSLRDHFEDPRWFLSPTDLKRSKREKQRSAVYGRMIFPDDLKRPCRTITATRSRGSRSTIVVPASDGTARGARTLTLRESATAQGFPLTYQFWAKSMGDKDTLVGNAVPPPLARSVALAILGGERVAAPPEPLIDSGVPVPDPIAVALGANRRHSLRRRFRGVVEVDRRHEHRVELDNQFPAPASARSAQRPPRVQWKCRLYLGYAKEYRGYQVDFESGLQLLSVLSDSQPTQMEVSEVVGAVLPTLQKCLNGFPDGTTLQARWTERARGRPGPDRVIKEVAASVRAALPSSRWANRTLPISATGPILGPRCVARGLHAPKGQPIELSVRLAAAVGALVLVCERLNRGPERLEAVHAALVANDVKAAFGVRRLPGIPGRRLERELRKPSMDLGAKAPS